MTVLGVVKNGHVRCPRCRYMEPEAATKVVFGTNVCSDIARCLARIQERERLDSWKARP